MMNTPLLTLWTSLYTNDLPNRDMLHIFHSQFTRAIAYETDAQIMDAAQALLLAVFANAWQMGAGEWIITSRKPEIKDAAFYTLQTATLQLERELQWMTQSIRGKGKFNAYAMTWRIIDLVYTVLHHAGISKEAFEAWLVSCFETKNVRNS